MISRFVGILLLLTAPLSFLPRTVVAALTADAATPASNSSSSKLKKVCIVGAGPAGLYLAHLLLQQQQNNNSELKIDILDRAPLNGTLDANAFGFGLGPRHQKCLEQIPGLWSRVEAASAPTTTGLRIIGRNVLCTELRTKLQELDTDKRCTVSYDTACESIDLERHRVTTRKGDEIEYDLLVGCDGVHSMVRKQLVEKRGLQEEHYLRDALWKSLKIPQQDVSVLDPEAFQPLLAHPSMNGAIIPRHPEGHTALIFWKDLHRNNPKGIETGSDLVQAITRAVQPKATKWDMARKLLFLRVNNNSNNPRNNQEEELRFDQQDCQRFVQSTPGREHYLKLDRYHDASGKVALVGDAAHGMYSFLGQGAACGFQSANLLAQSLSESNNDVSTALQTYSAAAVPEGHAINDLNLLTHTIFGGLVAKLLSIPLLFWNALRGKLLMKRLNDDVTYQQIYKENFLLVRISRYFWKKKRIPFAEAAKKAAA